MPPILNKEKTIIAIILSTLMGCSSANHMATAESFIDAFYSYQPHQLEARVIAGPDLERVKYYQAWAEAAHYKIKQRNPCKNKDTTITCAITVTDDFGKTLGYTATDTFTLQVNQTGQIIGVSFAGDDPPIFDELLGWIQTNQVDVLTGPCKDFFNGGLTPKDCARAVVAAAQTFMVSRENAVKDE